MREGQQEVTAKHCTTFIFIFLLPVLKETVTILGPRVFLPVINFWTSFNGTWWTFYNLRISAAIWTVFPDIALTAFVMSMIEKLTKFLNTLINDEIRIAI